MRTLKGLETFQWYKIFIPISGNFSFQTLGQPKPINNRVLKRPILYDITYMCNLKNTTNEYNKKGANSWIQRTNQWLPVAEGRRES